MKNYNNPLFDEIQIFPDEILVADSADEQDTNKEIAIIGVAGAFPDAENTNEFWKNIFLGKDCIREIPSVREKDYLNIKEMFIDGGTVGKTSFAQSGFLDRIDLFDYEFFSMSFKEAKLMDPNQRLFLQCCLLAIQDSGYSMKSLKGTQTGIFLGYSGDFGGEYKDILSQEVVGMARTGNIRSMMAARIAYLLDLHGPSLLVDTACSSSLTAVHIACQSIRNGECDMAIAGGVNVQIQPVETKDKGIGILSPGFRARTFDQDADGTGTGEGVGAVVLKELRNAVNDGDHIYAVIKGSAVNQDGKSIGITAPNARAQADLIIQAWHSAGIHPESVSFIEAHGTATKLGDPVEIDGIKRAFTKYTNRKQFCAIGSVKTNIGHLDNAAGIAGLIKCIYALKNKIIPPTIHFMNPNKEIDFLDAPVYINDKAVYWERGKYPRRCGINSFGLSGTNCHIVLEEYEPACFRQHIGQKRLHLLVLSAKNDAVLKETVKAHYNYLADCDDFNPDTYCYTVNTGRDGYSQRLAVLFHNKKELLEKLYILCRTEWKGIQDRYIFYYSGEESNSGETVLSDSEIVRLLYETENSPEEDKEVHFQRLAYLFVHGCMIPWRELYCGEQYRRITTPAYPFQKKRCWAEPEDYISSYASLVDRKVAETKDLEIYQTKFMVSRFWVLSEHRVMDRFVLPGTAYLEMVYSILKKNERDVTGFLLKDFTFMNPLQLKDEEKKTVQIIFRKSKGSSDVEIVSKNEDSLEWIVHCSGKVMSIDNESRPEKIDLDTVLKQAKELSVQKADFNGLIQTGDHWNCLKKIYVTEENLIGLFELPPEYGHEVVNYRLHPSMLDCAVNIPLRQIPEGIFLPFSYEKMTVYQELPVRFYSILKIRQSDLGQIQETLAYRVVLADEQGSLLAEAENYVLKRVHEHEEIKMSDFSEEIFHQFIWKKEAVRNINKVDKKNVLSIVFFEENGKEENIADIIVGSEILFMRVEIGNFYEKIDAHNYKIDNRQEDYERLFGELGEYNEYRLVYVSSAIDEEENFVSQVKEKPEKSFASLFYLIKALLNMNIRQRIELILISGCSFSITGREQFLNPFGNAVYQIGRVIENEYPNFICRCIDVDRNTDHVEINRELESVQENYLVAYRENIRYVQKMIPLPFKEKQTKTVELSSTGCYVITGGTGGLALTIALSLSEKKSLNFVLISRSGLEDKKTEDGIGDRYKYDKSIQKSSVIKQIKENGSTVLLLNADITVETQLIHALQEARIRFGKINGVIHAAGITDDKFLFHKDMENFIQVIRPKVTGSINLIKNITEPLEFFMFFSSVSVMEGVPGQSDYVAANGFMDQLVYCMPENQNAQTINWAPWKETGMAYDNQISFQNSAFLPLDSKSGVTAFYKALMTDIKQIVIGKVHKNFHFNQAKRAYEKTEENKEKISSYRWESISGDNISGMTLVNIQEIVKQLWKNLFEVEVIGMNDSFVSLGGNSIYAMYLFNELDKYFHGMLGISDIFTYPTISMMAEYLYSKIDNGNKEESENSVLEVTENIDDAMDDILTQLANGELDIDEVEKLLGDG